jgi:hypothetical protein
VTHDSRSRADGDTTGDGVAFARFVSDTPPDIRQPARLGVCNISVTDPEDDSASSQPRPWPADADWWRQDATEGDPPDAQPRNAPAPHAGLTSLDARPPSLDAGTPSLDAGTTAGDAADTEPMTDGPTTAGEVGEPKAGQGDGDPEQTMAGPFARPPQVSAQDPPPRPAPNAAINAPARLMPIVPPRPEPIGGLRNPTSSDVTGRLGMTQPIPPSDLDRTGTLWPAVPAQRTATQSPVGRPPRRRKPPRGPWLGLPCLVVLTLAAAFLAWVSAEPFWLAVGHGHVGTATALAPAAAGGCRASFTASGGTFHVSKVDLAGTRVCTEGTTMVARMVSDRSAHAYVTTRSGLRLRWTVGFGLVLLCGLGIMWSSGALRLRGWRRTTSVGLSFAGPVAIALFLVAVAY